MFFAILRQNMLEIYKIRWLTAWGFAFIFLFCSCSVLKRNRISGTHGIQKDDYDLPVIIYPSSNPVSKKLVIMLSGDGGWLEFNDQLASGFSKHGFHVIGFNSRTYFWTQKSPEQTTKDILLLIDQYSKLYKTSRIYLIGYSFGADIIPFIYNRLPKSVKNKVIALELLSPFASSDFMVHTTDLLNISSDNKDFKVGEELSSIKIPVYCFYGEDEDPKALAQMKKRNLVHKQVAGDHHYENSGIEKIINAMRSLRLIRL